MFTSGEHAKSLKKYQAQNWHLSASTFLSWFYYTEGLKQQIQISIISVTSYVSSKHSLGEISGIRYGKYENDCLLPSGVFPEGSYLQR
jgi:hypothetical protein